jgi:hypothetical protein
MPPARTTFFTPVTMQANFARDWLIRVRTGDLCRTLYQRISAAVKRQTVRIDGQCSNRTLNRSRQSSCRPFRKCVKPCIQLRNFPPTTPLRMRDRTTHNTTSLKYCHTVRLARHYGALRTYPGNLTVIWISTAARQLARTGPECQAVSSVCLKTRCCIVAASGL